MTVRWWLGGEGPIAASHATGIALIFIILPFRKEDSLYTALRELGRVAWTGSAKERATLLPLNQSTGSGRIWSRAPIRKRAGPVNGKLQHDTPSRQALFWPDRSFFCCKVIT